MQITKKIIFSLFIFSTSISFSIEPITTSLIISAAVQSYPVLKDGVQYFFPNKERVLNEKIIEGRSKFVEAKEKFRDCLFDSDPTSERGALNCPMHCKDLIYALSKLDGQDEAVRMIEHFDKLSQEN